MINLLLFQCSMCDKMFAILKVRNKNNNNEQLRDNNKGVIIGINRYLKIMKA